MSSLLIVATFLLATGTTLDRDSAKPKPSLAFSCLGHQFVSVAALAPNRDRFPAVQLRVRDPLGRVAGESSVGERIPNSSYGEIVQLREQPEKSKAQAVEICDAVQGVYDLEILESGNEPYVLTATGEGGADNSESLTLHHAGRKDRVREYKFRFMIKDRRVSVSWLDAEGHEQLSIEDGEW